MTAQPPSSPSKNARLADGLTRRHGTGRWVSRREVAQRPLTALSRWGEREEDKTKTACWRWRIQASVSKNLASNGISKSPIHPSIVCNPQPSQLNNEANTASFRQTAPANQPVGRSVPGSKHTAAGNSNGRPAVTSSPWHSPGHTSPSRSCARPHLGQRNIPSPSSSHEHHNNEQKHQREKKDAK